jgi:hypothetical protein
VIKDISLKLRQHSKGAGRHVSNKALINKNEFGFIGKIIQFIYEGYILRYIMVKGKALFLCITGIIFLFLMQGWSDAYTFSTNSVGHLSTVKITDMSGSLSSSGSAITVTAWDASGNTLTQSASATPLMLYNYGTTSIAGTDLMARFPTGTPMLYSFTINSSMTVVANVKQSEDGSLNFPVTFTNGLRNFAVNTVGSLSTVKITDMSGSLPASGAAITVIAWDASGNTLTQSASATPLMLYNYGTTSIAGTDLAARFSTGTAMTYQFASASSKYIFTNIKRSKDGTINVPVVFTSGTTNYSTNSVGSLSTLKITDMSGALSASGAAITVRAWDTGGNELNQYGSASPLVLYSYGTTTISGASLAARFPGGTPAAYEFTVGSSQYIITNVKNSMDGSINIPTVFSSGTKNFTANSVDPGDTIKISDLNGSLDSSGAAITVRAWDAGGTELNESGSALPLVLYSYGTTTIGGSSLAARFPGGTPAAYEFSVASPNYLITTVKSTVYGTLNIPNVVYIGSGAQSVNTISGNVVKGPVAGATVNFFALNIDGSKGALLGTTTTDSSGNYTVTLTSAPKAPILSEASGGSYVNEVTEVTEVLSSTDVLSAVLPIGTTQATVTPLTHMAASRARALAASGISLVAAVDAANIGIAQQYNLSDILGTLPVAAGDAAQIQSANRQQRDYGLILAGLTREATISLDVRPIDLAAALAIDMDDGILDGLGSSQVFIKRSGGNIPLSANAGLIDLGSNINMFENNKTNNPPPPIPTSPVNISGTCHIATTALPAWFEGNSGSATITTAAGCKGPVACNATGLPGWLRANPSENNLVLTGTAPLLSGGSTRSVSFISVACSDANGQTSTVQFGVTVVPAPPTTIAIPATCVAGQTFATQVATATGGIPPYYFKSPSFMGGAPPLGTAVRLDGTLGGKCPTAVGKYSFPVCAVDVIGADPCATASLTVTAPSCTYSISPAGQSFASSGGTGSVIVTTSSGCNWTATNNVSWITITSASSNTIAFTVAANTGTSQRTGTMTIAGRTFTVTQSPPPCTYSISPTSQSFASTGGSGSVGVTTSTGCSWTAASNASWINITSASSNTIAFTVAANTGTSQRTGTMTIAGQTFTVTQSPSCTYSISPTSQSFDSSGGTGSVNVTTLTGCSWTAASNASWITITSASSNTGNRTVVFTVAANTGTSQRTGTMTIAGQTFTVTQTGSGGGGGGISGTWIGTYTLTTDFSYWCYNVLSLTYSGTVTWAINVDILSMLTGTVAMSNMKVENYSAGGDKCATVTLTSWSAPIVNGGGVIVGTTVYVNAEYEFDQHGFPNYVGTNQLLYFTGALNGNVISGTIKGSSAGGTSGTMGTFSVTKQ